MVIAGADVLVVDQLQEMDTELRVTATEIHHLAETKEEGNKDDILKVPKLGDAGGSNLF
jgi:hypothetical protein